MSFLLRMKLTTLLCYIGIFGLFTNTAYAQYIVGADSDNKIILPIKNKNDSVGKMEKVKVIVHKKPSFVTSASVSPSGVTINKGAKRNFTVEFQVKECAMHGQTGDIELKLEATPENDYGITPDPKKFLKKVPLKVEEVPPVTSLSGSHWNILEIKIYDCFDRLIHHYTIPGGAYFSWSGSDNFTKPDQIMFAYALDGPLGGFGKSKSASYSFSSEGSHNFKVQARDGAKNVDPSPANYSFTISKETRIYKVPGPACWQPDENESVSTQSPELMEVTLNSKVLILNFGYSKYTGILLNRINEKFNLRHPFAPVDLFTKYPVLIIPSGALAGMENSEGFKKTLEEYVRQGGTIICFSQQRGYEFSALPGGENLSGHGWIEDQACWRRSVYIENYHHGFAGQNRTDLTVHVDGYFTQWPQDATILLRRNKNQMPAMIMYPYGKGKVIVSTLYTDWGLRNSQWSHDGLRLIRDLISWAKDPVKEIPEFKPNESINLEVEVPNNTGTPTSQVLLTLFDPDKNSLGTTSVTSYIPANGKTTLSFSHAGMGKLGIYWVNYTLLDANGNVVQTQQDGARFAVSRHLSTTKPLPELSFGVTAPAEECIWGSDATFTVHIRNNGDTDRNITVKCRFWWRPEVSLGTFSVPAQGNVSLPFKVENISPWRGRVWTVSAGFYEGNRYLASTSINGMVVTPSVQMKVRADKKLYRRGEKVIVTVEGINNREAGYDLALDLQVTTAGRYWWWWRREEVFKDTLSLFFPPASSGWVSTSTSFTLSGTATRGIYSMGIRAYSGRWGAGYASTSFRLPEPKLSLKPIFPAIFTNTNSVSFDVSNTGKIEVDGSLTLTLQDPDDQTVWSSTTTFAPIPPSGSTTINFRVIIPQIKFGLYKLEYRLGYEDKAITGRQNIPCSAAITTSLDKSSYKVRESLLGTTTILNNGKFKNDLLVTVSIPNCNFVSTYTISLLPKQQGTISFNTFIPDIISPGQHTGTITLSLSPSYISKRFKFTIPESKLTLLLDEKVRYTAGDVGTVKIKNIGGVDTSYDYTIKLIGPRGITIYEESSSGSIQVSSLQVITFNIDSQAVDGNYFLKVSCTDRKTNKVVRLERAISIIGLKAALSVTTDKKAYFTGETITATALINNLNGPIDGGNLNLSVFKTTQAISEITKNYLEEPDRLEISNDYIDVVSLDVAPMDWWWYSGSGNPWSPDKVSKRRNNILNNFPAQARPLRGAPIIGPPHEIPQEGGKFTIGSTGGDPENPNDNNKRLLYGHPYPWSGYTTIRIDGKDFVYGECIPPYYGYNDYSGTGSDLLMSAPMIGVNGGDDGMGIFTSPPHFEGDNIVSTWMIDDVEITQELSIVSSKANIPTLCKIKYTVENKDPEQAKEVGIRVMLDIQLGRNDGAPFRIEPIGGITKEMEFLGEAIPESWITVDSLLDPKIMGQGVLKGLEAVKPDRFVIAQWPKIEWRLWDYEIDPEDLITRDSAVALYWNPISLEPGESREVITYYGVGGVGMPQGGLVWKKSIPVDVTNEKSVTTNIDIPRNITGKLYLVAFLNSKTSQTIERDSSSFYITDSDIRLDMKTDKRIYKPGATITITSKVSNAADITAFDLVFELFKDDEAIFNSGTFSLSAQSSQTFTFSMTSSTSFLLTGRVNSVVGSMTISENIVVERPQVEMSIEAPEIVGQEEFDISVLLKNIGRVNAIINLDLAGVLYEDIELMVGEVKSFKETFRITENTTFTITLSGDIAKSIEKLIKFGEAVETEVTPKRVYPVGPVIVPFTLINTGSLSTEFEVTFQLKSTSNSNPSPAFAPAHIAGKMLAKSLELDTRLPIWCLEVPQIVIKEDVSGNKKEVKKKLAAPPLLRGTPIKLSSSNNNEIELKMTFYLPPGGSVSGDLIFSLAEGAYLLKVTSIFGTESVSFKVAKDNKVTALLKISSLEVDTEGNILAEVDVENIGANRFIGQVRLNTGFYQSEIDLDLEVEGSQTITFKIPVVGTSAVEAGTYTAKLDVLYNGNSIISKSVEFTLAPKFTFIHVPSNLTFNIGESGTISVVVGNIGSAEGEAEVRLQVLDFDQTLSFWLRPNDTVTASFRFIIPDDLEDRDYNAVCTLDSQERVIGFHVNGIKIKVRAWLDKKLYTQGQTATFTLQVVNESSPALGTIALSANVKFNDYDATSAFNLLPAETVTLTYQIPVNFTNDRKIGYGIYAVGGRAIHLNSIYIYQKRDLLTLYTDKQVYDAGATVTVTLIPEDIGTANINAPGYEGTIQVTGTQSVEFTLPYELTSGTYYINCTYTTLSKSISLEYRFDVVGYSAVIIESNLDKSKYNPEDVLKLRLKVDVNKGISSILRGWVSNPMDAYTQIFEVNRSLNQGVNIIDLTGSLSTTYGGTHRLIYTLYMEVSNPDEILLAAGQESFEVDLPAKIVLVSPTSGTIGTVVSIKGEGYGPIERICIDFGNTPSITFTTTDLYGVFLCSFVVNTQPVGIKTIKATGLTSNEVATAIFNIISIEEEGIISGKITKVDGVTPIPGVILIAYGEPGAKRAYTLPDGTYEFLQLSPGTYSVSGFRWGYLPYTQPGIIVTPGGVISDINLSLTKFIFPHSAPAKNVSNRISFDELLYQLTKAWKSKRGSFILADNVRIDFDCLMVATLIWNWIDGESQKAETRRQKAEDTVAELKIVPERIDVVERSEFEIEIKAKDVQELLGAHFKLKFDADVMEIVSVEPEEFLNRNGGQVNLLYAINEGIIDIAMTVIEGQPMGVTGSGVIAKVRFRAKVPISDAKIKVMLCELRNYEGMPLKGNKASAEVYINIISAITDFSQVYCYPNPTDGKLITFANLPKNIQVRVRIYNIAGEEVYDRYHTTDENGKFSWQCINDEERRVANGIYIYLLTDNEGHKKVGKIGVIK